MEVTIRFRDTSANRVRYEAAAKATGQSLSEWVRESLGASAECDLNEPGHAAPAPVVSSEVVGKVLPKDPKAVAEMVARGVAEPPKPRPGKTEPVVLTREEREAKIAAAQAWLPKGRKK